MANIVCTTFNISNGTFDLANDNLFCTSTWTFTGNTTLANSGTFTANTGNIYASTYEIPLVTTRFGTINMNLANWQANGTGNVWNVQPLTGTVRVTIDAGNSTIISSNNSSGAINFYSPYTQQLNNVSIIGTGTGDISFITQYGIFNTISSTRNGAAYRVRIGGPNNTAGNLDINKWAITGTVSTPITLINSFDPYQSSISVGSGPVVVDYMTISKIAAFSNPDNFYDSSNTIYDATSVNNVDDGGNYGWLFTANARYWVGGTGTWDNSSTTNWSSSSGGPNGANPPTWGKNVYFDANSGGGTITISQANTFTLNTTGFTGTFAGTGSLNIYKSLILSPNTTVTFSNAINFVCNVGDNDYVYVNTSSISIPAALNFNSVEPISLQSDLTTTNTINIFPQNWNSVYTRAAFRAETYNVTASSLSANTVGSYSYLLFNNSSLILTSSNGNVFTHTGTTGSDSFISAGNVTIDVASNSGSNTITFVASMNNARYPKLLFSNTSSNGIIQIGGTSTSRYFSNIASLRTGSPYTINFPGGANTMVGNLYVSGSTENYVTIANTGIGNTTLHFNVSANGSVVADWLSISNVTATPISTTGLIGTTANTLCWTVGSNTRIYKANNVSGFATLPFGSKLAAFINPGSGNYTIPSDWNPSRNQIVLIGGGGGSAGSLFVPRVFAPSSFNYDLEAGAGGGGGGLTLVTNFVANANSSFSYTVGAGGTAGARPTSWSAPGVVDSVGGDGGTTTFSTHTAGGGGGSKVGASFPFAGEAGGTGGSGTYTGGTGGRAGASRQTWSGQGGAENSGGGGGGAAGLIANGGGGGLGSARKGLVSDPLGSMTGSGGGGAGNGGAGGSGTNFPSQSWGAGGTNLTGGNGGFATFAGSNAGGSNGTNIFGLYGSGGGGSGGGTNNTPGGAAGGSFGGGAGGSSAVGATVPSVAGASGGNGAIIITYTVETPVAPVANNTSNMFLII
jgi:hypothetical protein